MPNVALRDERRSLFSATGTPVALAPDVVGGPGPQPGTPVAPAPIEGPPPPGIDFGQDILPSVQDAARAALPPAVQAANLFLNDPIGQGLSGHIPTPASMAPEPMPFPSANAGLLESAAYAAQAVPGISPGLAAAGELVGPLADLAGPAVRTAIPKVGEAAARVGEALATPARELAADERGAVHLPGDAAQEPIAISAENSAGTERVRAIAEREEEQRFDNLRRSLLEAPQERKAAIAERFSQPDAEHFMRYMDAVPGDDPAARQALQERFPSLGEPVEPRAAGEVPPAGQGGSGPPPPAGPVAESPGIERGFAETLRTSERTAPEVRQALEESPITYEGARSTPELNAAARARVVENPSAARAALEDELKAGRYTDENVALGQQLVSHYQDAGDFVSAFRVADQTASALTEAGRAVQAASIWDRLDPDNILRFTAQQLRKAGDRGVEGVGNIALGGADATTKKQLDLVNQVTKRLKTSPFDPNVQLELFGGTTPPHLQPFRDLMESEQWQALRGMEKNEAQRDRDIGVLVDRANRQSRTIVQDEARQTIGRIKAAVRAGDITLPAEVARSLVERANALKSLPEGTAREQYEKMVYRDQLLQHVFNMIPPSGWDKMLGVLGLPRSMKVFLDLGYPLRHANFQFARPRQWGAMVKTEVQSLFSEEAARASDAEVFFGKYAKLRQEAGVDAIDRFAPNAAKREEQVITNLAGKIPGAKGSDRAYIVAGNKLRSDVWNNIVDGWLPQEMRGHPFQNLEELAQATGKSVEDFKRLAQWLNITTGRGDISWLKSQSPVLNALFFAPRYALSRFQVPYKAAQIIKDQPWEMKGMVLRDLAGFMAAGAAPLAMLKAAGAEIDTDINSPSFGDAKLGPLHFNFWAGYQPVVRAAAQIMSGQVRTTSGRLQDVNRTEAMASFIGGKLNVIPGLAAPEPLSRYGLPAVMSRNEPTEQKLQDAAGTIASSFMPISFGEMKDAYDAVSKATGSPALGVAAVVGGTAANLVGGHEAVSGSVRPLQERLSQEKYNKAYPDLTPSQRDDVNNSDDVKAGFAKIDAQQTGPTPAYVQAQKTYALAKTNAESDLAGKLAAGVTGAQKRAAIQGYKNTTFQASKAIFTPDIKAQMEAGLDKSLPQILHDAYWSAEAPEDPKTGRPDFQQRDAARADVMKQARDNNVDEAMILDRGQRFTDPAVKTAVEAYEADQDTLKPYWGIRSEKQANGKSYAELMVGFPEKSPGWWAYENAVLAKERTMLLGHADMRKALRTWGYQVPTLGR